MKLILGIAIIVGAIWFATTRLDWVESKFGNIFSVEPTEDVQGTDNPTATQHPILVDENRSIQECRAALITVGEDILSPLNKPTTFSPGETQTALKGIARDLEALTQRDPLARRYLVAAKLLEKALQDRNATLDRMKNSAPIGNLMGPPPKGPSPENDFFKQGARAQWNAVSLGYRQKVSPLLKP